MSSLTSRILALLALAPFAVANGAEAGVIGSALSSFGRSSPAQTVQFSGSNCYYAEGWNGRGWYQCGDEWNDGFGWIGPFNLNTFGGPAIRRHHPHGVTVFHRQAPTPVFVALGPAAFIRRPVFTPAPRPSPLVLPAAASTAALAAAIFINFTAPEL